MLEIFRKSFELFRRHLVLWLPCTCAGLLNIAFARLERLGILSLARWMSTSTGRSVLGGEVVSTDPSEFQRRALMLARPLGLCREFVDVCLFVGALVVTAKLVRMIVDEQKPEIATALKGTVLKWRGILLFSLKFMLAMGAMVAIMSFATRFAPMPNRLIPIFASKAFTYTAGMVMEGIVAWLLMPTALRLLGMPHDVLISRACRRLATAFVVLASLAGFGVETFVGWAEKGLIFDTRLEYSAISVLNTIMVNAPEVLLFIAISLLAVMALPERDESRPSWDRGVLRSMMPMHIEPGKDAD